MHKKQKVTLKIKTSLSEFVCSGDQVPQLHQEESHEK